MYSINILFCIFGLFHFCFGQHYALPGIYNLELRNDDAISPFGELGDDAPGSIQNQPHSDDDYYIPNFSNIFNSNPFFSTFSGFGFTNQRQPWWKGPNVCKQEINEDSDESIETDLEINPTDVFNNFQFTVNSCFEKPNKYVCKRTLNKGNKKIVKIVTKQCCHGFSRSREYDITSFCSKVDLKTFSEIAKNLGINEFLNGLDKSNLTDELNNNNVTLFIPSDESFKSLSSDQSNVIPGEKNEMSFSTKELLFNHIVDGIISLEDLENDDILKTNLKNSTIRINISRNKKNGGSDVLYTANCIPIMKKNKQTLNGMLNVVDQVLLPIKGNLMDIISQRNDLTILKNILERTEFHNELQDENPITIFAPTDKAFEKLDSHTRRILKEGGPCAVNILKTHIIKMTLCKTAIVPESTVYNSLGQSLNFSNIDSNKTDLNNEEDNIIINGLSKIVEGDLMASNGVLHILDTMLTTESALPISSVMKLKNITVFDNLVDAAGLRNEFDQLENVTFFVPTDKAMSKTKWKAILEEDPRSLKNSNELKMFLKYHISKPLIKTCDLSEKLIESLAPNNSLRINLFSTHAVLSNVLNRATVNCARLVHFDDESCGTVLHQIDKALTPPTSTLLEQLQSNADYSNFYSLIKIANLTDSLNESSEGYTVFVPKNDVFDEFEDISKDNMVIENLVKTHIVKDVVCCAGIIPTNWPFVRTIESINNYKLKISRNRRPSVENAGITKCDIVATNGIIHEINDIIVKKRTTWPTQETLFK